jgi:hypothetical protein
VHTDELRRAREIYTSEMARLNGLKAEKIFTEQQKRLAHELVFGRPREREPVLDVLFMD